MELAVEMEIPASLNPTARSVAQTLLAAFPEREFDLVVKDGGHVEMSLPAPAGSHAGALVVLTCHDGDTWIHFAPPCAWYLIDDNDELVRIFTALLTEKALFAVTYAGQDWAGTTLVRPGEQPELESGQRAVIFSWSGKHDAEIE